MICATVLCIISSLHAGEFGSNDRHYRPRILVYVRACVRFTASRRHDSARRLTELCRELKRLLEEPRAPRLTGIRTQAPRIIADQVFLQSCTRLITRHHTMKSSGVKAARLNLRQRNYHGLDPTDQPQALAASWSSAP